MTDKEMLEYAAKAAGIKVPTKEDYPYAYIDHHGIHRDISCGGDGTRMSHWNPLPDDGDALRLAVRLAMTVRQEPSAAAAGWGADCISGAPTVDGRGPWFWKEWLSDNQDPYAATRRAIVRAAAEIGRGVARAVNDALPEDNYYKSMAEAEEAGRAAIKMAE